MGNCSWENKFETFLSNELNLEVIESSTNKVIIGITTYRQKMNDIDFRVKVNDILFAKTIYEGFDEVAFLVEEWISFTPSLIQVFGLLFGNEEDGLKVLLYLKRNKISANKFGKYLLRRFNLILLNKTSFADENIIRKEKNKINRLKKALEEKESDSENEKVKKLEDDVEAATTHLEKILNGCEEKILTLLKSLNGEVVILTLGEKASFEEIDELENVNHISMIHPSNKNIAKCSEHEKVDKYFKNWREHKVLDALNNEDSKKTRLLKEFVLVK